MNIPVFYNKNHFLHDPKFELFFGKKMPYAERALRLASILNSLTLEGFKLNKAKSFSLENILSVHDKSYVDFIKKQTRILKDNETISPSSFIMDTYTPLQKHTFGVAKKSVDLALSGAEAISSKKTVVYSLCRPPGHHAEKNRMGGYCYFNNSAIAANYLSRSGKVAILDIDFHHGNGTQSIFYDRSDILFVSIHADPRQKYPCLTGFENEKGIGKGLGFNINYPLSVGTGELKYQKSFEKALINIRNYKPKYLVVSAGFDTYINDPIGGFKLKIPFYKTMAQKIASLELPTLIIQEGGYNIKDLGKLAASFLKGFD